MQAGPARILFGQPPRKIVDRADMAGVRQQVDIEQADADIVGVTHEHRFARGVIGQPVTEQGLQRRQRRLRVAIVGIERQRLVRRIAGALGVEDRFLAMAVEIEPAIDQGEKAPGLGRAGGELGRLMEGSSGGGELVERAEPERVHAPCDRLARGRRQRRAVKRPPGAAARQREAAGNCRASQCGATGRAGCGCRTGSIRRCVRPLRGGGRCRLGHRPRAQLDDPVADARDRLDAEGILADALGDAAQARQDAIDRILADDAPFPASFGQFLAAHDLAARLGQREQHLHHARLDHFLRAVVAPDGAQGRIEFQPAQ